MPGSDNRSLPGRVPASAVDVLEDVPDRAALSAFVEQRRKRGRTQRLRVAFHRGSEVVEENAVDVRTDRGGELAELHFEDGTYCTVNVAREVERVEVER